MSRSKKKIPKSGITTAETEKKDKRLANRKFRRINNQKLMMGKENFSLMREVSNVWGFDKDGKIFLKNPTDKDFRK